MYTVIVMAAQSKAQQLVGLLKKHRYVFEQYRLLSTTEMGEVLERDTGMEVTHIFPARIAGDLQLSGLVCTNSVLAVFFLHDPLANDPSDADIQPFLRSCDINNVPLATNVVSGDALAAWLERKLEAGDEDEDDAAGAEAEAEAGALP